MNNLIDIQILPENAQKELVDFYHFLVERYVKKRGKGLSGTKLTDEQVNSFFDQFNLDLTNYKFDRDSLYER